MERVYFAEREGIASCSTYIEPAGRKYEYFGKFTKTFGDAKTDAERRGKKVTVKQWLFSFLLLGVLLLKDIC